MLKRNTYTEVETLKKTLKAAQGSNEALANDLKDAVEECEQCYEEIKELKTALTNLHENVFKEKTNRIKIEKSEKDRIINKLENDVEKAEQNWKDLKKTKDKEIYDLHKDQTKIKEKLDKVEFRNLTNVFIREKKSEAKATELKCIHCPDSLVKWMAHSF